MQTYVVLRDLSNASVAGPFETGLATVEEVVMRTPNTGYGITAG